MTCFHCCLQSVARRWAHHWQTEWKAEIRANCEVIKVWKNLRRHLKMWDPESTAFLNSCCYALLYSENTSPGCTTLGSECIVAVPPRALLI